MIAHGFSQVRTLLCLGAHADDLEIGCGGTLLRLAAERPELAIHWVVFSGAGPRRTEARQSAEAFLRGIDRHSIEILDFPDRYFPQAWTEIKQTFDRLAASVQPDLVFTHRREDLHQDHRLLAELTWNTFRRHWIVEYEIPKYEGDLGKPNLFVPIAADTARRKARMVVDQFPSQRDKPWFTEDVFLALSRLRGLECQAPSGHAEGFYARKTIF